MEPESVTYYTGMDKPLVSECAYEIVDGSGRVFGWTNCRKPPSVPGTRLLDRVTGKEVKE